jgi:hypothetical protein
MKNWLSHSYGLCLLFVVLLTSMLGIALISHLLGALDSSSGLIELIRKLTTL